MVYVIADWETSTKTSYGRKANPFDKDNYVVAWGLKYKGKQSEHYYMKPLPKDWLKDVKIIVAHNAKFDLEWIWEDPYFRQWLKDGGKLWCTQYAEYLLSGQTALWPSLDECAAKRGGNLKNDEIKAMWNADIDTIDIPKDMLCDYLDEDTSNTEIVYLSQVKEARERGMISSMLTHMEGLLGLIEMEHNGIKVDVEFGEDTRLELVEEYEAARIALDEFIPKELPEELVWNWGSRDQLSCLLFGGQLTYKKRVPILDEKGNPTYTKKKENWPTSGGVPFHPDSPCWRNIALEKDTYKSGAKAGSVKYKSVEIQGEPKLRYEDFQYEMLGVTQADPSWETKKAGIYKVDEEVLLLCKLRGIPLAELLLKLRKIDKDLGTYYRRYDPKKKTEVGMLTLVQPDGFIHHNLNNVATVTGRLSSSTPNMQNIPRGDKSKVKKCFISRFGEDGNVGESDFSQLEVVIQGLSSLDTQLIHDINSKVDFHCKRAAKKVNEEYEDVLHKAKKLKIPYYVELRQGCKEFSFQRSYGAGAAAIADSTGMDIEEVKQLIKIEDTMYSGILEYNERVKEDVLATRVMTDQKLFVNGIMFNQATGYHKSVTGKRYVFKESVTPDFMHNPRDKRRQPVYTSFSPTEMKNYPIQGLAGEVVIMCIGELFRGFLARDNFGGKGFLTNTVHDCIWADTHKDVSEEVFKFIEDTLVNAKSLFEVRYKVDCPVTFSAETAWGKNMLELAH